MSKGLEVLATGKKRTKVVATLDNGNALLSKQEVEIIEKELEEYQEIREIAKRYNWDDITNEIFNVKTNKKYRDLFSSAIVDIQEDFRKARAFEIIKEMINNDKIVDRLNANSQKVIKALFNDLTKEKQDLLKEVLNYGDKN